MSSISLIQNTTLIQQPSSSAKAAPTPKTLETPQPKMSADGLTKSSLKAGLISGGATAAIVGGSLVAHAVTKSGVERAFGFMLAGSFGAGAGIAGGVAGAVVAQSTDNKFLGTLLGAATGAATGAAIGGGIGRSMNGALTGAAVGAIGGAIGGLTSTYVK